MGNCIQHFFYSRRSHLKAQTLLNYQELSVIIKNSTCNDPLFYSSDNFAAVERFLSTYSLKPNAHIDEEFVNQHIKKLTAFVMDLRDRSSDVGKQVIIDQKRVSDYISRKIEEGGRKSDIGNTIKLSTVVLRLEIQIILLVSTLLQQLQSDKNEIVLQIQECRQDHKKKSMNESEMSKQKTNERDKQLQQDTQCFERIILNDYFKLQPKLQNNQDRLEHPMTPTTITNKINNQGQLQELKVFSFSSKVVNKSSLICIKLLKIKKNNHQNDESPTKLKKSQHYNDLRNARLLGQTFLSVADFIFYNSLVVSDVISLNSPQSIKSSITTTSSASTNNAVGYISVRGQGLKADSFEKDYIKIVKQHETLIQQLQMCLDGSKGWEKLSQFRNSSSQSRKRDSLYSDYSIKSSQMYRI